MTTHPQPYSSDASALHATSARNSKHLEGRRELAGVRSPWAPVIRSLDIRRVMILAISPSETMSAPAGPAAPQHLNGG